MIRPPLTGSAASHTTYHLHTLGWRDFQRLCGTILRQVWGQTYQTFADSADAGRDGAFRGKWKSRDGTELSGSFVAQCKFTAKANRRLKLNDVQDELTKAEKLAKSGFAKNYILLTNSSVTGSMEQVLHARFTRIKGIENFLAFGVEWISEQIRDNQRLRALVPRVYGLGDLGEILDERVYAQAEEILSWLGDELERFVVTDAHHRSVKALQTKGFVFLLGDPGSGKSTIAAALALAAADIWKSRVVKVASAKDFTDHWNPREPNQFFWVDDAFGQRQYERDRTLEWNYALPHLSAAIKRGARAIFTSRTYIHRDAIADLKESIFPLLKESRVVIEVQKLTRAEREQILYNHVRLGRQRVEFRRALKPFLKEVAEHEEFLPETARRLAEPMFTKNVLPTRAGVLEFVEKQEEYLKDVIIGLGDSNRAALGIAFMRGGRLKAGLDLSEDERKAVDLLNASVGEVRKALNALQGSLLVREIEGGETFFKFKHPTIRDAYGGVIGDDANLIDIFLRGAGAEMLVEEVTCGDVGLEGVKVVVPPDRFPLMIERLRQLGDETGGPRKVLSFLTTRCTVEFLEFFLTETPHYLKSLRFRRYLSWSQEAKFFGVLHQNQLLPQAERERFVRFASDAALSTPEWRFAVNPTIRNLFRPSELRKLRARVRRHLTSSELSQETRAWESGWDPAGDEDANEHFWTWRSELQAFAREFSQNSSIYRRFRVAQRRLGRVIEKLDRRREKKKGDLAAAPEQTADSRRSVFDDIDQ